jgi:hypothetical protein
MSSKEEVMNRLLRGLAAATALSALALSACGGSEDATAPPTTAKQKSSDVPTTTEAEPEPITAAEERWLEQIERYSERLEDETTRSGTITHATMRRSARLYLECGRMLSRAGDPGRFEPAARFAERGCERLKNAAGYLEQAIASSERGGFVIAGTKDEKRFDRALTGATEASGNGQYDLQRAVGRAEEIERGFGS